LEDLLEDQPGGDHDLAHSKGMAQGNHFGQVGGCVPSEGQGPHARIDEKAQSRERYALKS
jgi:hypothetical protein